MRERKEVQKMPRRLILLFAAAALSLPAAILPEAFGSGDAWKRTAAPTAATAADPELWTEFGFQAGESAAYASGAASATPITVTAWRFTDPTASFAAWQALAAAGGRQGVTHSGNYLIRVDGAAAPDLKSLEDLARKLPERTTSALPPLLAYMPDKGRVAGSERYALGPAALARFEPRIPRELASFERGAEAEIARYRQGSREIQLTLFAYPTPQIAIERFRQFEKLTGAAVKRSGTLIAVVPEGKALPGADKLLAGIEYRPNVTWNEYVPKHTTQDAANMILAISVLATGLIVSSLILGLFFGGGKILARRFGFKGADEDFTSLRIGQ
jgi:hypothetical protein